MAPPGDADLVDWYLARRPATSRPQRSARASRHTVGEATGRVHVVDAAACRDTGSRASKTPMPLRDRCRRKVLEKGSFGVVASGRSGKELGDRQLRLLWAGPKSPAHHEFSSRWEQGEANVLGARPSTPVAA